VGKENPDDPRASAKCECECNSLAGDTCPRRGSTLIQMEKARSPSGLAPENDSCRELTAESYLP
jgi:hypothetical protein